MQINYKELGEKLSFHYKELWGKITNIVKKTLERIEENEYQKFIGTEKNIIERYKKTYPELKKEIESLFEAYREYKDAVFSSYGKGLWIIDYIIEGKKLFLELLLDSIKEKDISNQRRILNEATQIFNNSIYSKYQGKPDPNCIEKIRELIDAPYSSLKETSSFSPSF